MNLLRVVQGEQPKDDGLGKSCPTSVESICSPGILCLVLEMALV